MDLYRIIDHLMDERNRINQIIQALDRRASEGGLRGRRKPDAGRNAVQPVRRRGRKSMDAAARKEVSERMRRYWASRRASGVAEVPVLPSEDDPSRLVLAAGAAN
jgi:hypothetical protein